MNSTIASPQDDPTIRECKSKCTPLHSTQTQKTKKAIRPTPKSEMHQLLLTLMAQKAHTVPGVTNKGHPADLSQLTTHTIATLCLYKPWQQARRPLLEPLYLEEMEAHLPQTPVIPTRTLSTSG